MRPKRFEYFRPSNLDDALELLKKYGEDAKILAGGQSLIPLMKMRILTPKYIIDISKIPELRYIKETEGDKLAIGALTTHYEVLTSDLIRNKCPILSTAARYIGDYQVRNVGTIGGSICHADPSAHYLPALLALEAEFLLKSKHEERTVKAENFFVDVFTTALRPDELLTEIRVPILNGNIKWGYESVRRRHGDFALATVATLIKVTDGKCESAKIIVGAISSTPVKLTETENLIKGKKLTRDLIEKAVSKAREELPEPITDIKASSEYRREITITLIKKILHSCISGD